MRVWITILILFGLSLTNVHALPSGLDGNIGFTGNVTSNTGSLATATALSFSSVIVSFASGDYAADGIGNLTPATMATLDFGSLPSLWWTVVGDSASYTFDVQTLNVDFQIAAALVLSGTGVAKCAAPCSKADQDGIWNLTANTSDGVSFNFSSTTAVPEPAILGLMGLGLLGLAGRRRQRAN